MAHRESVRHVRDDHGIFSRKEPAAEKFPGKHWQSRWHTLAIPPSRHDNCQRLLLTLRQPHAYRDLIRDWQFTKKL
jgi:hypothetical protein